MTPIELRLASDADRDALRRLAERDSRHLPPGPHLVACREGRIEAALSLTTRELVADPFRTTAELGELLRFTARRLRRERRWLGRGVDGGRLTGSAPLPIRQGPVPA